MDTKQLKEIMKDPAKMEEMLKKMFDALDKDKKGYIEPEVIKKQMKERAAALGFPQIEPTKEQEEEMKKAIDPNNTGKIDFEGFKKAQGLMMQRHKELLSDPAKRNAEIERIFAQMDVEKKGYLDVAKLKEMDKKVDQLGLPRMMKISEEQKKQILEIGDPTHSGKLTLDGCKLIGEKMAEKMKADGLL